MNDDAHDNGFAIELAADLVSAYVGNHSVRAQDLPELIGTVHAALAGLGQAAPASPEKPVPPVSIKKSLTPDYLISLEDGRPYKSLKRHLAGRGLTPSEYRTKWGLGLDYPMVAPNYAKHRSDLARASGLGRKRPEPAKPARSPRRAATSG